MIHATFKMTCILLLAATMVLLCGCKSNPENVSTGAIFSNLTPELKTTHERHVGVRRNMAANSNLHWRLFNEDLGRVFMTDHPTRLTGRPVPSASGHSR